MAEPEEQKVPGWRGGKPLMTKGAERILTWVLFLGPLLLLIVGGLIVLTR